MLVKGIQDMLTKVNSTGKHLKHFTGSFAYSAAEVWNTIPNNICNSETIGAFKHAYLKWCSHNQ